jgi:DNA-binding MarR family transcriptional regulator
MLRSAEAAPTAESSRPSPDMSLALQVHRRLARCRNLMMKEMRHSVERLSLTLPQFDVLAELGRAEQGFTFVELSRMLLVTAGNLTGIIDRLEAKDLVQRVPDPNDRRVTRMTLTARGRKLTAEILPKHAVDVALTLSNMSGEQLEQLNDLLGTLRDALHERARQYPPERPRQVLPL